VGKTTSKHRALYHYAVHPHVCGENFLERPRRFARRGSPPRVWGKPSSVIGLIRLPPVHPHVCGENPIAVVTSQCIIGSPPRVWGKRLCPRHLIGLCTVHPHVCGENENDHLVDQAIFRFTPTCVGKTKGSWNLGSRLIGSPPRVWGKLLLFIPTAMLTAVHPHVCGENA